MTFGWTTQPSSTPNFIQLGSHSSSIYYQRQIKGKWECSSLNANRHSNWGQVHHHQDHRHQIIYQHDVNSIDGSGLHPVPSFPGFSFHPSSLIVHHSFCLLSEKNKHNLRQENLDSSLNPIQNDHLTKRLKGMSKCGRKEGTSSIHSALFAKLEKWVPLNLKYENNMRIYQIFPLNSSILLLLLISIQHHHHHHNFDSDGWINTSK